MRMTKMLTVALAVLIAGVAFAAEMTLAEARAQISACIEKPTKVSDVIKKLSAEDQLAFLAALNEAIAAMPGSAETKAAAYLNVNHAAVSAAGKENKPEMLAQVFSTVPPEVLTIINERFAEDLLNIKADPSRKITEEQFTKIALTIMEKTNARCSTVEDSEVRSTFAILMLIRASDNQFPGLAKTLVQTLPVNFQHLALGEWIPAALGIDQEKSYVPILEAAGNAGKMPANAVVIRLAGPQLLEAMLPDLVEGTPLVNNSNRPEIHAVGPREDEISPQPQADPSKEPFIDEPKGYQGQLI